MTSSSSCSSSTVTPQELALFHSIDRRLFSRLVFNMSRDPSESLRVMGLFLWLEQSSRCRNLVNNLLSWPDNTLHTLLNEAAMSLECIFGVGPYMYTQYDDVPILFSLTKPSVSLWFFHENRSAIAPGVLKNVNSVLCVVFHDLLQRAAVAATQQRPPVVYVSPPVNEVSKAGAGCSGSWPLVLQDQAGEGLRSMGLFKEEEDDYDEAKKDQVEEGGGVPAEERTVFLTFSKGYPISETELREFFTRNYGEVVDDIIMQEVTGEEQQPLYARLVLRSTEDLDQVLMMKSKTKFGINGKHVWARKYIRKN